MSIATVLKQTFLASVKSYFEITFQNNFHFYPPLLLIICIYKNTNSECGVLVVLFHFGPIQIKIPHNSSKNLIAWNNKNKWTAEALWQNNHCCF